MLSLAHLMELNRKWLMSPALIPKRAASKIMA
jgi:hypothetical protein